MKINKIEMPIGYVIRPHGDGWLLTRPDGTESLTASLSSVFEEVPNVDDVVGRLKELGKSKSFQHGWLDGYFDGIRVGAWVYGGNAALEYELGFGWGAEGTRFDDPVAAVDDMAAQQVLEMVCSECREVVLATQMKFSALDGILCPMCWNDLGLGVRE